MSRSWLQDFSLGLAVVFAGVSIVLSFLGPEIRQVALIRFAFVVLGLFFIFLGIFVMVYAVWNALKTAEEAKDVDFKDYGNYCDEEPEHRHERAGNPERCVWNEEEVRSKQCGANQGNGKPA